MALTMSYLFLPVLLIYPLFLYRNVARGIRAFHKSHGTTGTKELQGLSIQIKQRLVLLSRKRFIVVTSR